MVSVHWTVQQSPQGGCICDLRASSTGITQKAIRKTESQNSTKPESIVFKLPSPPHVITVVGMSEGHIRDKGY